MLNDIITNNQKEEDLNNNLMLNKKISNFFIDKILALKPVPLFYDEMMKLIIIF